MTKFNGAFIISESSEFDRFGYISLENKFYTLYGKVEKLSTGEYLMRVTSCLDGKDEDTPF